MSKIKKIRGLRRLIHSFLAARLTLAALLAVGALSCASAPQYPVYPPPITATIPAAYEAVFNTTREILAEDPRLEIHTIDTEGRIIAREQTGGFIFWQQRTVMDFFLQPVDPSRTNVTLFLRAEQYEWGGLTRAAGWYPSPDVDTFLGEDVLGLIEKQAQEAGNN